MFFQLEATFIVNRVMNEENKYAVAVANLPFKVIRRIPRTLASEEKPYTVLKKLVVKETDLSDYQRSEKLHVLPALRDQWPSKLLAQSATYSKCRTAAATARGTSSSPGCHPSPEPSW